MREIWIKAIELINIDIDDASTFVKNTLDDKECIEAYVLKNTNFVKSNCLKDKIIIVLDSVINDIFVASLLELRKWLYGYKFSKMGISKILK